MKTIKNAYLSLKKISDIMLNAGSMIFLILSFLINEIILPIVTSIDIILKIAREYVIIGIAYLRLIPNFLFKDLFFI
jgi:hypothetical protein